jgi:hypothetical protein
VYPLPLAISEILENWLKVFVGAESVSATLKVSEPKLNKAFARFATKGWNLLKEAIFRIPPS